MFRTCVYPPNVCVCMFSKQAKLSQNQEPFQLTDRMKVILDEAEDLCGEFIDRYACTYVLQHRSNKTSCRILGFQFPYKTVSEYVCVILYVCDSLCVRILECA